MKPDNLLEKVKAAVKSREELQGVVCRYKYSRDVSSNPVCAFTLFLGMGKTKVANSADGLDVTREKEIKLCLLAPVGAGGKRLYEMACWVGEAIKEELSVNSIEVGEVKCEDTNNSLYSDIVVRIDDSQDIGENFGVFVSGIKLEDVISVEVKSDESFEKKGSLLNGYSLRAKSVVEHRIALKMKVPLFRYGSSFTLTIEDGDRRDTYSDCVAVNSAKTYLASNEVCYCYNIVSYKAEVGYRGVEDEH